MNGGPNISTRFFVTCNAGRVAIGAGFELPTGSGIFLSSSHPAFEPFNPQSWVLELTNTTATPRNARLYVLCVRLAA